MKTLILSRLFRIFLLVAFMGVLAFTVGCGDDDDDDDTGGGDDDDDDDNDTGPVIPTTLDVTLLPYQNTSGQWGIEEGPGESHEVRNDLGVYPTRTQPGMTPLSMAYYATVSDLHHTDEESPTRLTFFDSNHVIDGMFEAAFRPQEDLAAHIFNAIVRTANQLQIDYKRDFDLFISLGDNTDNAQFNEMALLSDVLDAKGLSSDMPGWARPDSGDMDIDPETGLNRGARDYGQQEYDAQGNNINPFNRPGYPNSNADFPVEGLFNSKGEPVPWFTAIGNHDVLNTGNFEIDGGLKFYTRDDYIGEVTHFGYLPGLGNTVQFWKDNPTTPIYINGGIFRIEMDWRIAFKAFDLLGMVEGYELDMNPDFDLLALQNETPMDPSDDGVITTPDPNRAFMGHEGIIPLMYEQGHAFADNNKDGHVDERDGGYFRVDWNDIDPNAYMPLRFIFLDATDVNLLADGGIGNKQLNWLAAELDRAVADKVLVIIASHHPERSIHTNGEQLTALLNSCPNVILHMVGHGHVCDVRSHPAANGDPLYGFWEVENPSLIEFPNQSRIYEIVDNRDGTGSIYMTLFDFQSMEEDDTDVLASLGRELSVKDLAWQKEEEGKPIGGRGTEGDRNSVLLFAIPDDVAEKLANIENDKPITSEVSLGRLYQ